MALTLHEHPFASYCWKVLIAFDELGMAYTRNQVDDEGDWSRLAELWPMRKIPVLVDDDAGTMIPESSAIIEYIDRLAGNGGLIPEDTQAALQARLGDRLFDGFVMTPMQKIVLDHLRPDDQRDRFGVEQARETLRRAYEMLNDRLAGSRWAAGESFTIADCAAAASLHYARAVEPWRDDRLEHLTAYYARLVARPSVARTIDGAREYRSFFPPGWPAHMD